MGLVWAVSGLSCAYVGQSLGALVAVWGVSWGRRGAVSGRPEVLLGRLWSLHRLLGANFRPSWIRPGWFRGPLGLS